MGSIGNINKIEGAQFRNDTSKEATPFFFNRMAQQQVMFCIIKTIIYWTQCVNCVTKIMTECLKI